MKTLVCLLFLSILFFLNCISSAIASDQKETSLVLHIHSRVSSGAHDIAAIARSARAQGIDALVITDLYHERYEYGLWPLRSLIKAWIERPSIFKYGIQNYLQDIQQANQEVPEVRTLAGAVVTPYYYWSGDLWPGPLILNNRGKDLIVFGLKEPADFENIPVVGRGNSRFSAYARDLSEKPYSDVINDIREKKGFVMWSHPGAAEDIYLEGPVKTRVISHSSPYHDLVLRTEGYDAIGIYSVELALVIDANSQSVGLPEGLWDQVLLQYTFQKRRQAPWMAGEVDYAGPDKNPHLQAIQNILPGKNLTEDEILHLLKAGNFYVVMPKMDGSRPVLGVFALKDELTSQTASMGGELVTTGKVNLKIKISISNGTHVPFQWVLIKNGRMHKIWDEETPLEISFSEEAASPRGYYRLVGVSESGQRILTNPIFFRNSNEN